MHSCSGQQQPPRAAATFHADCGISPPQPKRFNTLAEELEGERERAQMFPVDGLGDVLAKTQAQARGLRALAPASAMQRRVAAAPDAHAADSFTPPFLPSSRGWQTRFRRRTPPRSRREYARFRQRTRRWRCSCEKASRLQVRRGEALPRRDRCVAIPPR